MPGNKKRENSGFTLMEMVVVIAIFSTLILIVLNVFMLAMHAQRQTSNRQQVLANLRYVMETMAQKVRTSEIDYAHYGASVSPNPTSDLALIDQAGNNFYYSLDSVAGGIIRQIETGRGSSFALTELSQVAVTRLAFYINPITNPFAEQRCNTDTAGNVVGCQGVAASCTVASGEGESNLAGFCGCDAGSDCLSQYCKNDFCLPFDFQPRVTIVLGFQSNSAGAKPEEVKTIYLQTTVSSRVYKR